MQPYVQLAYRPCRERRDTLVLSLGKSAMGWPCKGVDGGTTPISHVPGRFPRLNRREVPTV